MSGDIEREVPRMLSLSLAIPFLEEPTDPIQRLAGKDLPAGMRNQMETLHRTRVKAYEERIFTTISDNSGKLTFRELLVTIGGSNNKKMLYSILSRLTRNGKITRIRGIGEKRIEFYYYDTKKMRKLPQSAA